MRHTAMFLALATAWFLSSAHGQSPSPPPPADQAAAPSGCEASPGAYWQPVFQYPENPQQTTDQLWKVDFQELVNKGRLTSDQANFLVKASPKAKESQGKLVQGYVIAFNSCTQQLYIDYQEPQPTAPDLSPEQQTAVVTSALNAVGSQQQTVQSGPSAAVSASGPSAGRQIGEAAAGVVGFANPLAFAAAPAVGFVGDGIQKGISKLAGRGKIDVAPADWRTPVKVKNAGAYSSTGVKVGYRDSFARAYDIPAETKPCNPYDGRWHKFGECR